MFGAGDVGAMRTSRPTWVVGEVSFVELAEWGWWRLAWGVCGGGIGAMRTSRPTGVVGTRFLSAQGLYRGLY